MSSEIAALTSRFQVERPDRDPTRQQDPYARRRQPPKPPKPKPKPETAPQEADADEPKTVGSRLNVRA